MGVHGGCTWGVYMEGMCAWGALDGVHGDIGWVYMEGIGWVCVQGGGGHQMGVHGGHKYPSLYATPYGYSNRWQSPHKPGCVYIGALDGCTWGH